jgi:peroxiredoxin
LRERAALEAFYEKYNARGFTVLAVNMGEPASLVQAYITRHRLSFPHLLDLDNKTSVMLGVRATPTNFLIDRAGRVRGGGAGYRDWASPAAHQLIESLLAEGGDHKSKAP